MNDESTPLDPTDAPMSPAELSEADEALGEALVEMNALYRRDPMKAVRGQGFIKTLHHHIAEELGSRLHPEAAKAGIKVIEEADIWGSFKAKDVDVAVVHPQSGPLVLVGVRSQMTSVGKNVLTYYQDIAGEAVSLQERFPMSVFGYVYLHPLIAHETNTKTGEPVDKATDYRRYARLYASISDRDPVMFNHIKGKYDEFAYMLVDFDSDPIVLRDDLISAATDVDLRISTFVDRIVSRAKERAVWYDLFK